MASYSHATARTKFVEAEGALIAYCSFGTEKRTPLLLLNHYRAGMDHRDPLVPEFMAHRQSIVLPAESVRANVPSEATPLCLRSAASAKRPDRRACLYP